MGTDGGQDGGAACAGFPARRERTELGCAEDRADRAEIRAAVAAHVAARDEHGRRGAAASSRGGTGGWPSASAGSPGRSAP